MTDYSTRIAALSPEKREVLLQRLKEERKVATRLDSTLPKIVPAPEQRHLPFPLTDVQRAYWIGRSGLFDLGAYANVYVEYEITFRLPKQRPTLNWRALLGWLLQTFGRKYLENRIITFFTNRLNLALQKMIERHDMLRAVVLPNGQQQILAQVSMYQIGAEDLRGQSPHHVEIALTKMRNRLRYAQAPTDQWPLFEFVACLLDGQRIRLLVRIDPLIIDGESRANLIAELNQTLVNPHFPLVSLECTYRDYALAWEAFQKSDLYQHSRDYWLAHLPTMPPAPELPLVQNISPSSLPHFEFLTLELLDSQTWQRLKAQAARIGLSPSGIALAAFVEVLAVWSLEPRFTVGLVGTYHPPMHPQIHRVFGNFNNLTLLMVEDWPGTFQDRAKQLWKQLVADLDHRYYSGHQVLQELNRKCGGSSRATIPIYFNSVIDETNQPNHPSRRNGQGMESGRASPYQMELLEVDAYFPQLLLTSVVLEGNDGGLLCKWQALKGVFPPGMIEDMFNAYHHLLRRLANDEQSWHETTRRLLPSEQLAQRDAINATEALISNEMLHTLFSAQVSRQPSRIAVVTNTQSLSYEALHRRSNQIGRRLRDLGACPNTLVAVVIEPGWEQVVAVLGILAAGAAYLPIDPCLPKDDLVHLLQHGEIEWVLTQSWLDKSLDWPASVQRLCVDNHSLWEDVNDRPPDPIQTADDLACVIYTLDLSQQPKGVMINHRGVVNTILDVNRKWDVDSQDRILALAPLSFDLSIYDIFGILAAGGTIVVPEASAIRDPARWVELIQQQRVTIWNSPPALLEMLLTHTTSNPEIAPHSLRLALLSRDRMSWTLPKRLKSLLGDVQVIELSGTAETSVWSGFYLVKGADSISQEKSSSLPLANQHLYVLDSLLEPRPVWVSGQVYVAGVGLAQGYWKDKADTGTRFVQHPRTGERLYRTGELGRFLPDGTLEFLEQEKDFQVVVHGYRVEPRQIETILEQHAAVRKCVVLARQVTQYHNRLSAYIVPYPGQCLSTEVLRSFIKGKLPDYMVPATFITLESLPLTRNGQVDRAALPGPSDECFETQESGVAPRNSLELQLVQIWETLLDARPIGVTDNFFDLGGNSFLAACLMNRIRSEFEVGQPLYAFMYNPTIEYLAKILQRQIKASPTLISAEDHSADLIGRG